MISVQKLDEKREPRMVRRVREIASAIPDGMVMPHREMADALGVRIFALAHYSKHPALEMYRLEKSYYEVFWGNAKTVRGRREKRANVKR